MPTDPEYSDIRNEHDFEQLSSMLREAHALAHEIRMTNEIPVEIRKIAFNLELETQESLAFIHTSPLARLRNEVKPPPDRHGLKYKRVRKGATTKEIVKFSKTVRKELKYSNPEFKCIDDFDKCKDQRGKASALCHLALFICLGKRIVPFVRQK